MSNKSFIPFTEEEISRHELPEKFTFPFYYEPHGLALIAASHLQEHLKTQKDWEHNFGIDPDKEGLVIGKMFGVLVVKNEFGTLGYLTAFSGKMAGVNDLPIFVPPIFDMLKPDGFFRLEEIKLNEINARIKELEEKKAYKSAIDSYTQLEQAAKINIEAERQKMIAARTKRRTYKRQAIHQLSSVAYEALLEEQKEESLKIKYFFNKTNREWEEQLSIARAKLDLFQSEINQLKADRKEKSAALQQKLFNQYHFLNIKGETKKVTSIFESTFFKVPPAGAGECAAPKLLQYAFQNKMKPICMAEFWWGASPGAEVRKSGNFYPACRGKCEPILGHMLEGMAIDENPMLKNPALGKEVEIIYEDEDLAVINKPAEFLSVPGKTIMDSVKIRMKRKYPESTGPLIVHRLDMSTSGIMLIAKTKEVHKILQWQFINHSIVKRYVALLDGIVKDDQGKIDLPLRGDLHNRPQQMVCHEHGKQAITKWKVLERKDGKTRVHFFPITGRTHQLRMHASHHEGLNIPILGDDLYGTKADRLHLHADYIKFKHPSTKQAMEIEVKARF